MKTPVGPRNHVLDGSADPPRGRGNFWGCPGYSKVLAIFAAAVAAASAAKGIIQYARQTQIGMWKILSAGDAAYRPGTG